MKHYFKGFKKVVLSGFLLILLSLFGASFILNEVKASEIKNVVLTWENDPTTTMTISWRTELKNQTALVYFKEAEKSGNESLENQTKAETVLFETNLGVFKLFFAELKNLKPATKYHYKIISDNESIEDSFVTGDRSLPFTFLVFGDSQSYDYSVWGKTVNAAYEKYPQANFMVNVGDLVDRGQDYREWNAWFQNAQLVLRKIPLVPVVGNHETYGLGKNFSKPFYFTMQFKLPMNGPENLKKQVYSFDYGNTHFVVLDSQFYEQSAFVPEMMNIEKLWLEDDLQKTDKKWKIAFLHRPIFGNRDAIDGSAKAFAAIFEKYQTDLVFTGHEHVYARTYPMLKGVGSASYKKGQGTVYVPSGRSGTKYYTKGHAMWWNSFFYNPQTEPNYLVVNVNEAAISVLAVKQDGTVFDSWEFLN